MGMIGKFFNKRQDAASTPVQAKEAKAPAGLEQIVTPDARDRWLSGRLKDWTPDAIEATLRGALTGDLRAQWELFDLMEETWPRLQKNLNDLKDAVVSLDWGLQAWTEGEEDATDSASEKKSFVEGALWRLRPDPARDENHFEATLKDILDAWGKGISVLEINWEAEAGGIVPRSTSWVHPRNYGYAFDGAHLQLNAREIGLSRGADGSAGSAGSAGSGWADFPENKFLLCVAKQKSGHPIGGALLRPLAWWWCASNFSAGWLLNFAQIFGLPIRWATYDPHAAPGVLKKICSMLANMGSAAWAAFPAGTTFELKEASKSGGGADTPQGNLLDRADTQCDLLILGQTLTSDVGESGSRALGDVHERVRGDRIMAAARFAATVLNYQFVPAILRLNWGEDSEAPYFQPAAHEAKDATGLATRDQILLAAGIAMPKQWFYERHEIPVPADGDEVVGGRAETPGSRFEVPGSRSEKRQDAASTPIAAKGAREAVGPLVRAAVADAAEARERWLEPLSEELDRLAAAIRDERLSDGDVAEFLRAAQESLPDLFARLNVEALADSLEAALGAAAIAGAREGKK